MEKARFLQDVGLSHIVLARELDFGQIAAIRAAIDPERCTLGPLPHAARPDPLAPPGIRACVVRVRHVCLHPYPEQNFNETGEVPLMITTHCVRYSLSLCPKQAKGVTGVQGTVRAAPLTLVNASEKLTLRFDCKASEMHVVGKLKPAIARKGTSLNLYKTRPAA